MGWATVLDLTTTHDGVLVPLKAFPKARSNSVSGIHDGRLRVSVTAAPERGKANAAIVKLLAKQLGIAKREIVLVRGETSQLKTVLLRELSVAGVAENLAEGGVSA